MLCAGGIARRIRNAPLSRIKWPSELCPYTTYYEPAPVKERPPIAFVVRRGEPELVRPASLTPRETKALSALDEMLLWRAQVSMALLFRGREAGVNPAAVIRRALRQALVHYYPLAGRVRETEGGKLEVECTGEGVVLVQADADVELADLEAAGLRPPLPCWEQLLLDVEGSSGVLNCPLLHIQVTRLLCGGFVLGLRFNHVLCDGLGITQFLNAVGELARGLPSVTVTPVWSRGVIKAMAELSPDVLRRRPRPTPPPPGGDMVTRSFCFSPSDMAKMKKSVRATTFEALVAFIWRARTAAMDLPAGEDALLAIPVDIRGARVLGLPAGYYGNAVCHSTAQVESAALCRGSLGDAVALVQLAKAAVSTKVVGSLLDNMVLLGQRPGIPANWFGVTDARNLGLARVDFGWGEPVFAGPVEPLIFGFSFVIAADRGAVCVPLVLPRCAMDRFQAEVESSLRA